MKKVLIIGTILMMAGMVMGQNYGVIGMPGGTLGGGELDSIAFQTTELSSDITLTSDATWYKVDSITLDAGVWLVMGNLRLTVLNSVGEFKINDGSTDISTAFVAVDLDGIYPGDQHYFSVSMPPVIYTASGTTKLIMSAYRSGGTAATKVRATGVYSTGPATVLTAIKLSGY